MQRHHKEKHHFRITFETNNRMRSISFSISLRYAPPPLSAHHPHPFSTSTHSGSSSRLFPFQNSLEWVPILCITYPQHHKINYTINFLSSLENHANKTFSEKSSCPVSDDNLLWVLLWKLWTNVLTLKVLVLPWVQEQWHKYSCRWMLTMLGLWFWATHISISLAILRNHVLW